jgi:hypothetical protein
MLGLGLAVVCAVVVALTDVLSTHKESADLNFQNLPDQVFFIDDRTGAVCDIVCSGAGVGVSSERSRRRRAGRVAVRTGTVPAKNNAVGALSRSPL